MPLLYYWTADNHYRDLDWGAGFHLNQRNPLLHSIDMGDSLWAFTRNKAGDYVLAAELVVQAKTRNRPGFRYGDYRIWGDLRRSRYFVTDGQPTVEPIIRALTVTTKAARLGQSFQGHRAVKTMTAQDDAVLRAVAAELPLEPRARLLPEDRLEALFLSGDAAAVERLLRDEPAGVAEERRRYLYEQVHRRDRDLPVELKKMYGGRCQVCVWDPRAIYGKDACHAHHIHWLSRGGDDSLSNLLLLCPNHHQAVHAADAPLDWADMTLVFPEHREVLQLDRHLAA